MGQSGAEEEEWEEYPILMQRRSFMGYSNRKAVFSTGTMINDSHLTGPGLIISCRASFPLLLPCFTGRRVTDCLSTRIGFHVLMGGGVYETKLDYKEWTTITTTTTIQLRSVCLCLVSLSKWPNVEYNHPQLVSTQLETDHRGMRFAWDTLLYIIHIPTRTRCGVVSRALPL